MSRWTPGRTGPQAHWYRRATRDYLKAHPICWLCALPGADTIDHVIPTSKAPALALDPGNWRPAHRVCNARRGNRATMPPSPRSRRW